MSYIHTGVFVPTPDSWTQEKDKRFAFSPLGNSSTKLVYWDKGAWASELMVSSGVDTDEHTQYSVNGAAAGVGNEVEAKAKKRKAESKDVEKLKKVPSTGLLYTTLTDTFSLHLHICNSGAPATLNFMASKLLLKRLRLKLR